MDVEQRLDNIETKVSDLRQQSAVMAERQDRLHSDFDKLANSISELNASLTRLNNFITNRKGFVAGFVLAISVTASIIGALLFWAWDLLTSN